jgi:hypothetical protein
VVTEEGEQNTVAPVSQVATVDLRALLRGRFGVNSKE